MIMRFTISLLLCSAFAALGGIMPADRMIDWSLSGIPGGIPNRTTIYTNLTAVLDTNGVSDCSGIIQAAIDNCPGEQVVQLPAGRLRCNSTIEIRSWKTLRGAGMGRTTLESYASVGIIANWAYWYWCTGYLAPAEKGSTNLVISSGPDSPIYVGYKVMLDEVNSPERGVVADGIEGGPGEYSMGQISEVMAKSGNNITVWPPLTQSLTNAPRIRCPGNPTVENLAVNLSIEDLSITNALYSSGGDALIYFNGVSKSWLKNVRSRQSGIVHLRFEFCFRNEVQGCEFLGTAPPYSSGRNYGLQFGSGPPTTKNSFNRVENNVWNGTKGPILGYGSAGNVIAYNLITNVLSDPPTNAMKAAIFVHSGHPQMNLFEGNIGNSFLADFFHGSSSHQTVFRNWFYGSETWTTSSRRSVEIDTTNRFYSVIGNILGKPGLTGFYEVVAPAPAHWDDYKVWMLGYVGEGGDTALEYPFGSGRMFYWDPVAISSLHRHGNFDYVTGATNWVNGYDQTLPASLYRTTPPSWWGTNAWPAIGPDVAGYTRPIPAEVRYTTGYSPSGSPSIIPDTRRIDWSQVGAPIVDRAVAITVIADTNGVTDATAAIQSAINSATYGQAVFIPSGRYKINSLSLTWKSGITLRGAGPTNTVLVSTATGGSIIQIGNYGWGGVVSLTNGMHKGSTNLVVSDGSVFIPGESIVVDQLNDGVLVRNNATDNAYGGACTWCSRENGARALSQMCAITAVNGNTLTVYPPLHWTYSPSLTPQAAKLTAMTWNVGVENIGLAGTNGIANHIRMDGAGRCWVKNVESYFTSGNMVTMNYALRCTVRDSFFHDQSSWEGGVDGSVQCGLSATECLIENNVFQRIHAAMIVNWGASGNVYAFNFATNNMRNSGGGYNVLQADIIGHGSHHKFNLFEGNSVGEIWMDNGFGSGSHNTFFRNQALGWTTRPSVGNPPLTGQVNVFQIEGFNWSNSVVGNVLGAQYYLTNTPAGVYETQSPTNAPWGTPYIYRLGYRGSGDGGTLTPLDTQVAATLIREGNWDVISSAVRWTAGAQTLGNSYVYTAAPSWWGTNSWPAIGPDVAGYTRPIPAEVRYATGYSPDAPPYVEPPIQPPSTNAVTTGTGSSVSGRVNVSGGVVVR